jgi:hypothetical protein
MQDFKNDEHSDSEEPRVYCDVQMSLAEGRYLLDLVTHLRDSASHPAIDIVLEHITMELETSIEIASRRPAPEQPV